MTTLEISSGGKRIGELLVDNKGKLRQHTKTLPKAVTLKVYHSFAKCDECFEAFDYKGRQYSWRMVTNLEKSMKK